MPDHDALAERLRAVERALADDADRADLREAADLAGEVESLDDRLDEVEDRLDELDAATQALRGYVGNVRAVNDAVERRADAALAAVERLEDDRDAARGAADGRSPGNTPGATGRDSATAERVSNPFDRTRPGDADAGSGPERGSDRRGGVGPGRTSARNDSGESGRSESGRGRSGRGEPSGTDPDDAETGIAARVGATLSTLAAALTGSR